jgi:hypothetical protein
VLKTKVHSAKVMDYEGIKALLSRAKGLSPRVSHLWMDAGYSGEDKGADWVEKALGWTVEIVGRPRKAAPEEVLMAWAKEWSKEGVAVDWRKLLPPRRFVVLPRRWMVGGAYDRGSTLFWARGPAPVFSTSRRPSFASRYSREARRSLIRCLTSRSRVSVWATRRSPSGPPCLLARFLTCSSRVRWSSSCAMTSLTSLLQRISACSRAAFASTLALMPAYQARVFW